MPILKRTDKPDLFYQSDDYTDPWRNAPYLILQHGNGRSSRFWYSWVPYLSRFYRVVRPDMRGLGQSSRRFNLETDMSIAELVGDLIAIIDALGADSVHFCGESSGGIIGLGLAAGHPARVKTLSLVSTPVFLSDKMKQSYALEHGSRADAMRKMGIKAWVDTTNRSTRFPPETDPEFFAWYAEEFAKGDIEMLLRLVRVVNEADASEFLPKVKAPVLGLYPTAGPITDEEQERLLLAKLPRIRMVHLPTRYHMLHQISPATCAIHVLHFLAEHDGFPCHEA
jgi:3-oxoadipate enol-lactonase